MNRPLLLAVLLEAACILRGLAPLAEIEGQPPPLPQPAALRAAAPERRPVDVEAMLARPPFTPGRAVPRRDRAPAPELATLPRLTGLIVAEQRRAIFAGPGEKPIVVSEGSRLGPFTVMAVRPDGVDLAGPPGARTLRPSSDAALRSRPADKAPILALIDPDRREAETESDQ